MPDIQIAALKARIECLEAALGQNQKTIRTTYKLPCALANLLGLLLNVQNANCNMIEGQVACASNAPVAIHRLRTALLPYNIQIQSKRSLGWWLDDDTKDRINTSLSIASNLAV